MNRVRQYLGEGKYRSIEICFLFILYFALWLLPYTQEHLDKAVSFFKVASAITTALSVIAFSLRNRVSDYAKERISEDKKYKDYALKVKDDIRRITDFVLYSFLSSILCLLAGISGYSMLILIAGFAVIYCSISYIHILYAHSLLEEAVIDIMTKSRSSRELSEARTRIEENKKKYPDT